jgi:hypothetical protein
MITRFFAILPQILMVVGGVSCVNARTNLDEVHSQAEQEFTLGIVQRDLHKGMTQAEVAAALGSPNIVNRDREGVEAWVYDKIASVTSYSRSSGGFAGLGGGGGSPGSGLLLGLGMGSYDKNTAAVASTQKTLTVIIKFGKDGRVSDYSYHSSKF